MGWDLDAVAMVGDQERRPLEQRVGRLVPVELDLESSATEEDAEGEPFEPGRQPGREGEVAVVVAHAAEAGDGGEPRTGERGDVQAVASVAREVVEVDRAASPK